MRGKHKMQLRGLANSITQRHLLGKATPDDGFYESLDKALEAHELIKVGLLESVESSPKEIAKEISEKLGAEVVQIIGRVIVLYRQSKKNPRIKLED